MFRRFALLLILSFLVINTASALSTTMKADYAQGETIIARIDGSLTNTISNSQIEFKRANVRVPVDYDVEKLGSNYYFWATSPNTAGNYTLYIYNVATQDHPQAFTYSQNFSIGNNRTDYSINPAVIIANGNFNINVLLNLDSNTQIQTDFPSQKTISLFPGNNQVNYAVSNTPAGLYLVNIGMYQFPVYVTVGTNSTVMTNDTNASQNNSAAGNLTNSTTNSTNTTAQNYSNSSMNNSFFIVEPVSLNRVAFFNSSPSYSIIITNGGNYSLNNINISYDSSIIRSNFQSPLNLGVNQSYQFNISFVNPLNGTIKTTMRIISDNGNSTMPISIDLTKNITTLINTYSQPSSPGSQNRKSSYYCSELSGTLCPTNTLCSGTNITSIDGQCCLGQCAAQQTSSGSAWIGYLIAGVIVLVLAFVWYKYKKVSPKTNPLLPEKPSASSFTSEFKSEFKPKSDSDFKPKFDEDLKGP